MLINIITHHTLLPQALSNKEPYRPFKRPQTFPDLSRASFISKMTDAVIANVVEEYAEQFVEHPIGSLEFSAYKYHHNRNPYYILFIKNGSKIYIEMINDCTHRHKIIDEIVMPFEVMEKNDKLKKYYDLSVKMVNTRESIFYDTVGVETKHLIQTYDTDSETDEDEDKEDRERKQPKIRHWCINCDCVWKNLNVSKGYNIYYNMNPLTYEYRVNTEKAVDDFLGSFDSFAKYNLVAPAIEATIMWRT